MSDKITDKKPNNNSNREEKPELIYKNYPESAPETRDGGTLTMILLVLWYGILSAAGLALLGFVALFVACMA